MHPELGTLEDFRRLLERAKEHGIEIALDIAFQCSPDHPYVKEHPEWFRWRPDGTIQYAENPPKKYQDIYPFDFETRRLAARCGTSCKSIFAFWIEQGVRIFRVDNPHTKPFAVLGMADRRGEARPSRGDLPRRGLHAAEDHVPPGEARLHAVVHLLHLAQHQARTDRVLHRAHASRVARVLPAEPVAEHAGHPDRVPAIRRPAGVHAARLVLAATLGASYGIYGPAFELLRARRARSRQRGVSRLREVRDPHLGPRPTGQPAPCSSRA